MNVSYVYKVLFYRLAAVFQVVNDITSSYMQTYKKFKMPNSDKRLRDTLRMIQTGVSHVF